MASDNFEFRDVSGNALIIQAGGNVTGQIIAGNQTIINNIIQQARQIVAAPYKFLNSYAISDRDIFFGRESVIMGSKSSLYPGVLMKVVLSLMALIELLVFGTQIQGMNLSNYSILEGILIS